MSRLILDVINYQMLHFPFKFTDDSFARRRRAAPDPPVKLKVCLRQRGGRFAPTQGRARPFVGGVRHINARRPGFSPALKRWRAGLKPGLRQSLFTVVWPVIHRKNRLARMPV